MGRDSVSSRDAKTAFRRRLFAEFAADEMVANEKRNDETCQRMQSIPQESAPKMAA